MEGYQNRQINAGRLINVYIVMTIIRGVFNGGEAPGRFPPLDVMRFFCVYCLHSAQFGLLNFNNWLKLLPADFRFKDKMHLIRLLYTPPHRPGCGSSQRSPMLLAGFQGSLSKGEGNRKKGRERGIATCLKS